MLNRVTARTRRTGLAAGSAYALFRDLAAALLGARVIVAVIAATGVGLVGIPQAVDSLITLAQENRPAAWAFVLVSTAWLDVSAWFWARVALGRASRPEIDRHPWLRDGLARVLGAASFLAVANAMWHAAGAIPVDMTATMGAITSGDGPLRRAAIATIGVGAAFLAATAPGLLRRMPRLHVPQRFMVAATLLIAAIGMWLFGANPLLAARVVPPLPTILFAASGLICGGVALGQVGARWHLPLLAIVIAASLAVATLRDRDILADNHDLGSPGPAARGRPTLAQAFAAFLDDNGAASSPVPVPIVLVAAGGGGLAAADFTATVLGDLADASPDFARHIFAISGVSGGALGAAEYALAAKRPYRPGQPALRSHLQDALAADFLGPVVGAGLYSDLMQRFLPVIVFPDREKAIEAAWAARWRHVFGDRALQAPFLDIWAPGHPWPALLLNGTSQRTGGRLVTSNLDVRPTLSGDGADLLRLLDGELSAAAAIGTSTRFPFIAPLGVIRRTAGAPVEDRVADGGYFENLGATTLLDVLDELARPGSAGARKIRFVVIEIISNPDLSRGHPGIVPPPATWLPVGLIGPASVLLRSRDARGVYAAEALAQRVLALGGAYLPVRLGQSPTGTTAPLGWSLSATARHLIDVQWTTSCRAQLLRAAGFASEPVGAGVPGSVPTGMTAATMWQAPECQVLTGRAVR